MKPATKNKESQRWASTVLAVSVLTMSFVLSACGNKNNSSPPPPAVVTPAPVTPTCSSCPGGMSLLATAMAESYAANELEFSFEFYGDSSTMGNYQGTSGYYGSGSSKYYGPFASLGKLYLGTALGACNIPAGTYTLQTAQAGVWGRDGDGRSGEGLVLTASGGPAPITIQLNGYITTAVPAAVSKDGRQFPYRFTGKVSMYTQSSPIDCQRYIE